MCVKRGGENMSLGMISVDITVTGVLCGQWVKRD